MIESAPHQQTDSDGFMVDASAPLSIVSLTRSEERRIFWSLLLLVWITASLTYGPFLFSSGVTISKLITFPSTVAIGMVTNSLMRLVYMHLRQRTFVVKYATILVMAIIGASLEAVFSIAVYEHFSKAMNWTQRFSWLASSAISETWFLLGWAALYISFVENLLIRKQQEALASAAQLAHTAQIKMLRYQLNPHFLFNTLNSLSSLIVHKQGEEAESMLMRLSRFLRYSLDSEPTQLVSLEEEIGAQKHYLAIEKARFGDKLDVVFDIEDDLADALVPSLLIQPLVENAIKHAFAPSLEGGTITIRASSAEGMLHMQVEDTGPGVEDPHALLDEKNPGVGVRNTYERIKVLYGEKGQFSIVNKEEGGLRISIAFPLRRKV